MPPTIERRGYDEDVQLLKRTIFGEQINGNCVEGIMSKTDKMYAQYTFMFRIYKGMMIVLSAVAIGVIMILIKIFSGGWLS